MKIAHNEWAKTPDIRSNVQLDVFVVMPNHIHGIIVTTDTGRGESHSPHELHSPKIETNLCHHPGVCDTPLRSPSNTIGAIIRGYKTAVTKRLNQLGFTDTIWQRNYYEHIVRNEQSYQNIANYIINNPATWEKDKFYMKKNQ